MSSSTHAERRKRWREINHGVCMMQERYAKSGLKARDKYLESSGWSYFGRTLVPPHPHPTPAGRSHQLAWSACMAGGERSD
jgi:hypothetical protein